MDEIERIEETINRVAPSVTALGKNDPTALSTKEGYVYRETGIDQIYDIVNCGYVRSNEKRKSNQVWWTSGGANSFHVNKRPILVASSDIVVNEKAGAISIDDLSEIWMYDEQNQKWNNKINDVKSMRVGKQKLDQMQSEYNTLLTELEKYAVIPQVATQIQNVKNKNAQLDSINLTSNSDYEKIILEKKEIIRLVSLSHCGKTMQIFIQQVN